MILQSLPDPEETRHVLASVLVILWAALESGLLKTREYFEPDGLEIDPWLAANITRYHARRYLQEHRHDGDYDRIDLLNCGLRVVAVRAGRRYDLWVRKSDDGALPVPQSETMLAFYHQPVMIGFYPEGTASAAPSMSLLVLWEAPKSYTHITAVTLSLPAAGGESRADIEEHWSIPVPHPMTTVVASQESEDDGAAPDLDIESEAGEQTGTGEGENQG